MTASALLVATLSIISFVGGVRETSEKGDFPACEQCQVESQAKPPSKETKTKKGTVIVAINTASEAELCALPGVGPARAQQIIKARQRRPFNKPADLKRVKGIGAKRIKQLEGLLDFSR